MEIPKWRLLSSSYLVRSPFLTLRRDAIELPDGTLIDDYYVREGTGFSVIFALTPENEVVLVRQYKYGINRVMLELPAGFIDPGEDPRDAAIRELAEETGYVAESVEFVRAFVAEPSNSQVLMHVFLARNARLLVEPQPDVTEDIQVQRCTIPELRSLVASGEIEALSQVAAIYFILENIFKTAGLSQ